MNKTAAIVFLATVCLLAIIATAFGAAPIIPPFPFQNTQQLVQSLPGWHLESEPQIMACAEGQMGVGFQFVSDPPGGGAFQVWVSQSGKWITGAYYVRIVDNMSPSFVYFGTINAGTQHITITEQRPFDPTRDYTPCDKWKD